MRINRQTGLKKPNKPVVTSGGEGVLLQLSSLRVPSGSPVNTIIGTLSVLNHSSGSSGWVFVDTIDGSNKFNTSGANLRTSGTWDRNVAPEYSVTITATKTGQEELVQSFTVRMTVELGALTGTFNLKPGDPEGTLAGVLGNITSGSTLSLGLDDAGGRVALSGNTIVAGATPLTVGSYPFTVYETNADGSNSPNSTTFSLVVAAPVPAPVFTEIPSISPTSGDVGDTFTADDGLATNANSYTRVWLMDGSPIGTGVTVVPSTGGNLVLRVTAHGVGGDTISTTAPVVVTGTPDFVSPPTIILHSTTQYPPPIEIWFDASAEPAASHTFLFQASTTFNFASPFIDLSMEIDDDALDETVLDLPGTGAIASPAETYFRAKLDDSAWSTVVKHGDVTPPTITSSLNQNVDENTVGVTFPLTFSEEVALVEVIGGVDPGKFSISGSNLLFYEDRTVNGAPDYEIQTNYSCVLRCLDYGDNLSEPQTFNLAINNITESTPSVLSQANKSSYINLSNGDLTATSVTGNVGNYARIRATQPRGGKVYFEATAGALPGTNYHFIGICTEALAMNTLGRPGTLGAGFTSLGQAYGATGTLIGTNSSFAWSPGAILGFAVDFTLDKMWRRNASGWDGDPVAGTGGISIPALSEAFVFLGLYTTNAGPCAITVNLGATPFTYTVPTGFVDYN